MAVPAARTSEAGRLARSIARRTLLGGLAGAVLVYVYLAVLSPSDASAPGDYESPLDEIALAGVLMPVGFLAIARAVRGALRWLDDDRAPSDDEQRRVLRLSSVIAAAGLTLWLVAALVVGLFNALVGDDSDDQVHSVVGVVFGGLVHTAVGFGLAENALRPYYRLALRGQSPDRLGGLGVRTRLLLAWALGSAVPMLAIGTALVGRTPAERADLTAPIWFLVVVGLLAGAAAMVGVAGAAADRLQAARRALARVREGDLDVELPVDDASEVGSLQAGFNEMVGGLRERRRIEDLFGRHVGTEVARRALDHDLGLGGEQRVVTALFVDLVGSTSFSTRASPDEVVRLLNAFFAAVVDATGAEGGWVNKFEGDAALCVFGAPDQRADHADRGLTAARRLGASLAALRGEYPLLDAGIGVSSGMVVAGNVGAEQRYEYTVIGDAVNEAARLADAAKGLGSRVVASGGSLALATRDEAAMWRLFGSLALRGRATTTDGYEPQDPSAPR